MPTTTLHLNLLSRVDENVVIEGLTLPTLADGLLAHLGVKLNGVLPQMALCMDPDYDHILTDLSTLEQICLSRAAGTPGIQIVTKRNSEITAQDRVATIATTHGTNEQGEQVTVLSLKVEHPDPTYLPLIEELRLLLNFLVEGRNGNHMLQNLSYTLPTAQVQEGGEEAVPLVL